MFAWLARWLGVEKVHEVVVQSWVVDDLCEMARGAYPKEMLAFIDGTVRKGVLTIDGIQLQAYHASVDSAMANLWQLPTHTTIVGTVHSHPTRHNRPSDADLELFSQFGLVHAIIGRPYRGQDIRWMGKDGRRIRVRISED